MRDLSNFIFCCAFVRSNIPPRYVNEMQNRASDIKQLQRLALFAPCDFWEWVTRYIASQCQIVSNANFRLPLWLCCNPWRHCRKQKTQIKTTAISFIIPGEKRNDYAGHRSHQTACGLPMNRTLQRKVSFILTLSHIQFKFSLNLWKETSRTSR